MCSIILERKNEYSRLGWELEREHERVFLFLFSLLCDLYERISGTVGSSFVGCASSDLCCICVGEYFSYFNVFCLYFVLVEWLSHCIELLSQ